ncbi:MAG: tetratricopeptide repeat protein [Bacteroidales bacterium]|nr:tetratricopeptide repeat protein [Bacteroidales bacterium]
MKKILAVLLILIPFVAMSQAKKSDVFYYKGFELINAQKYKEAISHYEKCSLLDKEEYDISERAYYYRSEEKIIECYEALAEEYYAKYNFDKALRYKRLQLNITKKIFGGNDRVFAQNLEELADINSDFGNNSEALELQSDAVKIYKKLYGDQSEDYARALGSLVYYNYQIGNYIEALKLENIAIKIRKELFGDDSPEFANSADNLANCYAANGNYEAAIRLEQTALDIFRKNYGEEHCDFATSLSNLANFYSTMRRNDEAIEMGTRAMEIRKKLYGDNHPIYAMSLVNLAYYHYEKHNCNEAIKLVSKACKIFKNVFGKNHNYYARTLKNLAKANFRAGNYGKAAKDFQQSYSLLRSYVLNNFSTMTYNERMTFWMLYSEFFGETLALSAYKHPSPALLSLAYNGQIFAKGLTLNAELEILELIEKSGDKTFADRYRKIKKDRVILDRLYYTSPEKREINADSLADAIEREEKLLVESSKELGDYTRRLSVEWKDVQKQLTDKDIAIEFMDLFDDKNEFYAALIIKKHLKNPQIVHLFDADELATIKKKEYYTSPALNSLIWSKLESYLADIENVYFSPSGIFYTTGIEYLPDENGVPF